MIRPAFLIAADANLPRQVKPAGRREPQPGRGMPIASRSWLRRTLICLGKLSPQGGGSQNLREAASDGQDGVLDYGGR